MIGVGNADRGDDGAGVEVARALAAAGVPCILHEGDGLGLIDAWTGFEFVVVVDAVRGSAAAEGYRRFDAVAESLPREVRGSLHGVGLAQTIEIARALGRLPEALNVYAVAASSFVLGEGVSALVARACTEVTRRIGEEIRLFRNPV